MQHFSKSEFVPADWFVLENVAEPPVFGADVVVWEEDGQRHIAPREPNPFCLIDFRLSRGDMKITASMPTIFHNEPVKPSSFVC